MFSFLGVFWVEVEYGCWLFCLIFLVVFFGVEVEYGWWFVGLDCWVVVFGIFLGVFLV